MASLKWRDDLVAEFWWYVAERHSIYMKRTAGEPWPWTNDSVLQKYRFTNVYRELDKGTVYLIDNILPMAERYTNICLYNILLYRRWNSIPVHEALTPVHYRWDEKKAFSILKHRVQSGLPNNGSAWTITPSRTTGEFSGLKTQCERMSMQWRMVNGLGIDLWASESLEEAHGMLMRLPGVGDFLAYELVCDLMYSTYLLGGKFTEDDWVNPGPGCTPSLDRMIEGKQDKQGYVEAIKDLRWNWQPMILDKPLTLRNVEHCLCEYRKYVDARDIGRHKRRFTPPSTPTV